LGVLTSSREMRSQRRVGYHFCFSGGLCVSSVSHCESKPSLVLRPESGMQLRVDLPTAFSFGTVAGEGGEDRDFHTVLLADHLAQGILAPASRVVCLGAA
jgi:hypothetical protein